MGEAARLALQSRKNDENSGTSVLLSSAPNSEKNRYFRFEGATGNWRRSFTLTAGTPAYTVQGSRLRVATLDYKCGQDACEKGKLDVGLFQLTDPDGPDFRTYTLPGLVRFAR